MAKNIFNETDFWLIHQRIQALDGKSVRLWGKMSLAQMIEHCAIQLKMAMGMMPPGPSDWWILKTAIGRWLSLYTINWPHGSPTPAAMDMYQNGAPVREWEWEKQHLLNLLYKVQQANKLRPHPFYGPINKKDWGRLIWKHLDHHLRQFGQ